MPSAPGDPHAPGEDIIELTDMIERGPGAPQQGGAGDGMDLSFERELEDLFGDSPEQAKTSAPDGMPGLDDLNLPEEGHGPDTGDDIDLDGLDALLAEAEKGDSAEANLPELPDDFMNDMQTEAKAATGAAALADAFSEQSPGASASPEALDALNARLDELETAVESLKADISAAPAATTEPPVDPAPLVEELSASLREELAAMKAELESLAQAQKEAEPTPDSQTLAEEIKAQLAEALPAALAEAASQEPAEPPVDPASLVEELSTSLREELAAMKAELEGLTQAQTDTEAAPDSQTLAEEIKAQLAEALPAALAEALPAALAEAASQEPAEPSVDPASLVEELSASLREELAALKAEVDSLAQAQKEAEPASDSQALAEEIKAQLAEALPAALAEAATQEPAEPPVAPASLVEELSASLREELAAMKASILAQQETATRLEERLSALETGLAGLPDTSSLVSAQQMAEAGDTLRQELLAEIRKAVPAAAAQVIREEIQALLQEEE